MKTFNKILCLVALLAFSSLQAIAQEKITKTIPLSSFKEIAASGALIVILKQSDEEKLIFEGSEEAFSSFSISNDAGSLVLRCKICNNYKNYTNKTEDKVYIFYKNIEKLEASGASSFIADGSINAQRLSIDMEGASDVKANLNVAELEVEVEGAANLTLSGNATSAIFIASGAADIKAQNLVVEYCKVKASGASDVKVNVTKEISYSTSGASNLKYIGNPVVKKNSNSSDFSGIINISEANGVSGISIPDTSGNKRDTFSINLGRKKVLFIDDDDDDYDNDEREERSYKRGDRSHRKREHKPKIFWAGFGMGVNGYLNKNHSFSLPQGYEFLEIDYGRSWSVFLNPIEQRIPVFARHVNLVTGLGFEWNNYKFDNNFVLIPKTNQITAYYDSINSFEVNKLTITNLNIPLLIQFDTRPLYKRNTLHMSLGMVGSLRIYSYTKQSYTTNGVESTPKTYDDFSLTPFRYSAMVRIGFGRIDLFAQYCINKMFKTSAPELHPFTIGLMIVGF